MSSRDCHIILLMSPFLRGQFFILFYFFYKLQQALVGEGSGEEQLFSSESNVAKDGIGDEVYNQLQKLKVLVPH